MGHQHVRPMEGNITMRECSEEKGVVLWVPLLVCLVPDLPATALSSWPRSCNSRRQQLPASCSRQAGAMGFLTTILLAPLTAPLQPYILLAKLAL